MRAPEMFEHAGIFEAFWISLAWSAAIFCWQMMDLVEDNRRRVGP